MWYGNCSASATWFNEFTVTSFKPPNRIKIYNIDSYRTVLFAFLYAPHNQLELFLDDQFNSTQYKFLQPYYLYLVFADTTWSCILMKFSGIHIKQQTANEFPSMIFSILFYVYIYLMKISFTWNSYLGVIAWFFNPA